VQAAEIPLGDPGLEFLQGHFPQVRAIVEHLGQALAEVRILRTGLELNQGQVTAVSEQDQVHAAGVERGLPSHDDRRADQAEFLQRKQLGVQLELLLKLHLVIRQHLGESQPEQVSRIGVRPPRTAVRPPGTQGSAMSAAMGALYLPPIATWS
jgi:hypothetical protein